MVIAIISKFLIVDWPETAKFLTPDEQSLLLCRLASDQGEARMDRFDKQAKKRTFMDVKLYLG